MAVYRTLAIFQGKSMLPRDRFVNTWHFEEAGLQATDPDSVAEIHSRLAQFYNEETAVGGSSIADFMSSDVLDGTVEFRTYNLADDEPREPITEQTEMLFGAGTPLPTEVACCLSFFGTRSVPRQRGRVYLGPLTATSGSVGAGGIGLRPSDAFVNVVNGAAARLLDRQDQGLLYWSVLSVAANQRYVVTGGWVDNAYDTQRRRGTSASTRALFGNAVVAP